MSIIKLDAGQRISMTVKSCESVQGNFGPQYKLTGADGDVLFLNQEPVDKQFARVGLDAVSVVGQSIDIERVEKNGTKYTNIYKTSGQSTPGARPVAKPDNTPRAYSAGPHIPEMDGPLASPDVESGSVFPKIERALQLYTVCFEHAHSLASKVYDKDESHEATAAMAATMFIQLCNKGLAA